MAVPEGRMCLAGNVLLTPPNSDEMLYDWPRILFTLGTSSFQAKKQLRADKVLQGEVPKDDDDKVSRCHRLSSMERTRVISVYTSRVSVTIQSQQS